MTQTGYVVSTEKEILTEGKDFKVTYKNNKKPGTASVIFNGIGNYTGTKKVSFKIKKGIIEKADYEMGNYIQANANAYYAKGGAKPIMQVIVDGYTLKEGVDYTVKCSGNTKITDGNTAKATIKGKGYFTTEGAVEINFAVLPKIVNDGDGSFTVTAADKNLKSGKASKISKLLQVPKIKDSVTGKPLAKITDYDPEINYYIGADIDHMIILGGNDKNKELGAYYAEKFPDSKYEDTGIFIKAEFKLTGCYTGFYSVIYRVADSKISSAKAVIEPRIFTGSEIKFNPEAEGFNEIFKVTCGGETLKYGEDFMILQDSYKNNIKNGTASVTIRGLGKYSGTKTVKFKIVKKKLR